MEQPIGNIPDSLAVIIPFIAAALSSYLRDAGLKPWKNAVISFAAVLATSILCLWLVGGFQGQTPSLIVGGILLYVSYLLRNDYQVLLTYLFVKSSPIASVTPVIGVVQKADKVDPIQPTPTPPAPAV